MNPAKFDASYINKTFYQGWKLAAINCGDCYSWAYLAYKIFNKANVQLWSTSDQCHAFVKVNGKFYDSECVNGAYDWRKLACNKECKPQYACRHSLKDFKSYWNFHGKLHWKKLDNTRAFLCRVK